MRRLLAVLIAGIGIATVFTPPTSSAADRDTRPRPRATVVASVPFVDFDEQYEIAAVNYLAWRAEQEGIEAAVHLAVAAAVQIERDRAATIRLTVTQVRPSGGSSSCGGDFDGCFKDCTISHESLTSGVYGAVSPGGTYRGAFQFAQGTWNNAVAAAGYPEWVGRPANEAPPHVQDAAARYLYSVAGNQPWGGRC